MISKVMTQAYAEHVQRCNYYIICIVNIFLKQTLYNCKLYCLQMYITITLLLMLIFNVNIVLLSVERVLKYIQWPTTFWTQDQVFIYLFIYLFVYLFLCFFVCLFVRLLHCLLKQYAVTVSDIQIVKQCVQTFQRNKHII